MLKREFFDTSVMTEEQYVHCPDIKKVRRIGVPQSGGQPHTYVAIDTCKSCKYLAGKVENGIACAYFGESKLRTRDARNDLVFIDSSQPIAQGSATYKERRVPFDGIREFNRLTEVGVR